MRDTPYVTRKKMTIGQYRQAKLRMLKDFCIQLTDEQLTRFNELETEVEIDNFCRNTILKFLNEQ